MLWDDGLIAADIVLPADHPLLVRDVVAAYRWVGEAVRGALADCGVAADLLSPDRARATARDPLIAAACFGSVSPWEAVVGGAKLVGLSQVRRRGGGAIQIGVPWRFDAGTLGAALEGETAAVTSALEKAVTDLARQEAATSRDRFTAALRTRIGEALGERVTVAEPEPDELAREREIAASTHAPLERAH